MNAARRNAKRRGWPARLYEPRPGYYVFRHPDGRTFTLGQIPLQHAIAQVVEANLRLASLKPLLTERIEPGANTMAALLEKMPVSPVYNTAKTNRSLDKKIAAALGKHPCNALRTMHCAQLIEAEGKAHPRQAGALRSRLVAVCAHAQAIGWMDANPAAPTKAPPAPVKRERLTLETFCAILKHAPEVNEWLYRVMLLAVVLGADPATMATLKRADVIDGALTFKRSKTAKKTGRVTGVPVELRCEALGVTLRELVEQRTGVVSPYILHHVKPHGQAPAGSPLTPQGMSKAFLRARRLAGIEDSPEAPTLYECRSLAARLYEAQGGVDVSALLGHSTEKMTDVYRDSRGAEVVRVRVA